MKTEIMITGLITKGIGGLYTVKTEHGYLECKARGVFRKDKLIPMVGDKVEIEEDVITSIFPRKNSLIRPPCSNIDKLFLVVAMKDPEPNIYNIDKMLTIAFYHNIEPVIIFNKTDLDDVLSITNIYSSLPIKKYSICATSPDKEVVEKIKQEISGYTVALSGLSGVGKSSIMKILAPDLSIEVGDISQKLQRGKHTTRHVELFELFGGMIMDTPGFSNLLFEYFDIKDRSILENYFPEFKEYLTKCRFKDCVHIKEPDCAIINAVKCGKINENRYKSYIQMYDEIGVLREWENK